MSKNLYYNPKSRGKKKKKDLSRPRLLSEEIKSTYYLLIGTLAIMLVVTALSYLYISSQTAGKGYLLQQLQTDYEDLTSESKTLDTKLLDIQSITNIDEEATVENMEKPEGEEFSFIEEEGSYAQN